MEEEGEKKQEKREVKKTQKKKNGRSFFQVGSFILLLVLIIIILIVVQVPYTTTNAIVETVPVEKCTQGDMPFVANFRTGLTYDSASNVYSLNGEALYKYSKLKQYVYANVRNMGQENGIYCINTQAYLVSDFDFNNNEETLLSFQNLISEDSEGVELLDNSDSKYSYPVCSEREISPLGTGVISLWTKNIISEDIQSQYDLNDVYVMFTIVAPASKQCKTEYEEQTNEEEVTRYCNAWKHLVGKC